MCVIKSFIRTIIAVVTVYVAMVGIVNQQIHNLINNTRHLCLSEIRHGAGAIDGIGVAISPVVTEFMTHGWFHVWRGLVNEGPAFRFRQEIIYEE